MDDYRAQVERAEHKAFWPKDEPPGEQLLVWRGNGFDGWAVEYVRADLHQGAVGILETAVAELDGWRDKGSDVMRDENVDDFIAAAKTFLASHGGR